MHPSSECVIKSLFHSPFSNKHQSMVKNPNWVFFLALILPTLHTLAEVELDVKLSLLDFFEELSDGTKPSEPAFGWTNASDPCTGNWTGVICHGQSTIKRVALEGLGLRGTLDLTSICDIDSLSVLSIKNNSIRGEIPDRFTNCNQLTQLYLNNNNLSGPIPQSIAQLSNLKRLDISSNNLTGELPNLARISGLIMFLAQNNQLTGQISPFDFSNLQLFNVSNNNFSGQVPFMDGRFNETSIHGNSMLCGKPLNTTCDSSSKKSSKSNTKSAEKILLFLGYILLGVVFISFIAAKLLFRNKTEETNQQDMEAGETNMKKSSKTNITKSNHSTSTPDASMVTTPLVVLPSSPALKKLKFEDLLRAPAELIGRGRHGSVYKVVHGEGPNLAVKRIKDWNLSREDFEKRMKKIGEASSRHPNILPPLAFYCSEQEKLLVYQYEPNGSLYNLLNGRQRGRTFDWNNRLNTASKLANALSYMHRALQVDGLAHGNLKSSNIMFNTTMEPCISEYGLMPAVQQRPATADPFKSDVYDFGVVLLELLTGKPVQSNGCDLAAWVQSVVREEWTAEVFDKELAGEGASEEKMVRLLQVAVKCIEAPPEAGPSMGDVAAMVKLVIEEEDDRSTASD